MVVSKTIRLGPKVPGPELMSMVAGPPQLNVTKPPSLRAAFSAASVQLAAVPVPTTPAASAVAAVRVAAAHRTAITSAMHRRGMEPRTLMGLSAIGTTVGFLIEPPATQARLAHWITGSHQRGST